MLLVLLLVLGILSLGFRPETIAAVPGWSGRRRAHWLAAVATLTAALTYMSWYYLSDCQPAVTDEIAYLLQAEIFASGQLTAPPRPDPELFLQYHIFSAPRTAAKYFPGQSLLLVPGILVNWPPLIPLLSSAITAVLLFELAVMFHSLPAACLGWLLWAGAPAALRFQASYFSQTTTTAAWTFAFYAICRWRQDRNDRWFVWCAAAAAVVSFTRPMSGLLISIPLFSLTVQFWVRERVQTRRLVWHCAVAVGFATFAALVIGISNYSLTGSPWKSGVSRYVNEVMPYDRMGFGLKAPGLRSNLLHEKMTEIYEPGHRAHTLQNLPRTAATRLYMIYQGLFQDRYLVMVPFFIIGLLKMTTIARLWVATTVLFFFFYLFYAHNPGWTLYYFETFGAILFATAVGVLQVLEWGGRYLRTNNLAALLCRTSIRFVLGGLVFIIAALRYESAIKAGRLSMGPIRWIRTSVDAVEGELPDNKLLMYAYGPAYVPHWAYVVNGPFLDREPTWRVHIFNSDSVRRAAELAPHKPAWLFDTTAWSTYKIDNTVTK